MDKFGYVVEIITHTHEEEHSTYDLDDPWNRPDTYSDNTFKSIRISNKGKDYPDIVSDLEFKPGDEVWVVWLEYSTGDSFGHDARGGTASIAVFREYEDAENLEKAITNPIYVEDKYSTILFETSYGEVLEIYTGPWTGYFEHLDDVHIEKTWMQGAKDA